MPRLDTLRSGGRGRGPSAWRPSRICDSGGRDEVLDVGGRHHHRDGAVDRGVDEPVLVPQRLEEMVDNVRPAVHHRRRRVAGVVAHYVIGVPGRCVLLVAVSKR